MAAKDEVEDFEITVEEGFEIVRIDEGAYDAELSKMTKISGVEVFRNNKTELIDMLKWTFTLPDGIEVSGTSSTKFSPQSKGYSWVQKLLGKEIATGTTFRPKDLVGTPCQVVVKDRTRTREFRGKKEEQTFSVVTDVMAAKKPKEAAKK
jgi:hypothetical protein